MSQLTPDTSEDQHLKGFDPHLTRRILAYMLPYKLRLAVALLLMLISSGAAALGPYLFGKAIDQGIEAGNIDVLRNISILYLFLALLQWGSIYLRVNIMARVGQSIIFDLREDLFGHLQQLSLGFYSRFSVGRVITRVINDVSALREFITWAMLAIARDLFTVIFIIAAMLLMSVRLTLISFAVLPIMLWLTSLFRKKARENYRKVRLAISWVNSVLAENINGVRVVQAFSRQPVNYANFSQVVNQNNLDTNLKAARVAVAFPAVVDFLGTLSISLVVLVGGISVLGLQSDPSATGLTAGMLAPVFTVIKLLPGTTPLFSFFLLR